MKTRTPRRYYHRHYVNVTTQRQDREVKDVSWSTALWFGTVVALTGVVFSVVYVMA